MGLGLNILVRNEGIRIAKGQFQQEMTERNCAEQAVQEAREFAESIVETVREPLVVLDTDLRVISVKLKQIGGR